MTITKTISKQVESKLDITFYEPAIGNSNEPSRYVRYYETIVPLRLDMGSALHGVARRGMWRFMLSS